MLDENGLYDPRPIEDDDDPVSNPEHNAAYRIRSDDTWDMARDAYLSGETAEGVCARFDLGISTFWERAKRGGWRRCDRSDPQPLPVDADDDIDFDADYAELAEHALRQLRRAMARGQASAAASWMRLHDRLSARAEQAVQAERKSTADATARRRAQTHATLDLASSMARSAESLAQRIAALDPRDSAGHAAIDAELSRLDAEIRAGMVPIPDNLDNPDTVFDPPPSPLERGPPGPPL